MLAMLDAELAACVAEETRTSTLTQTATGDGHANRRAHHAWLKSSQHSVIRQRLSTFAKTADARSKLWQPIDDERGPAARGRSGAQRSTINPTKPIGSCAGGTAALLLRARDPLGNDLRSFLVVYLIGHPRGIRMRLVQQWTAYSYRSISEAAVGWERAGVVRIQHGHCVLTNPAPWCQLLGCRSDPVVVVNWVAAYEASVVLLRTLRKAREKKLALEHPLIVAAIANAAETLASASAGEDDAAVRALAHVRSGLSTRS
ncbi:MAG: hypothetical protein SGJ11_16350 [Phycisphaerae bacterium]|nr:hypothetical protein [Phycisphaerae bacterium]